MSYVNADSYAVLKVWQNIKDAVSSIENTKSSINRKYQQLGADWTDKKHKELGEIIQECNRALNSILKTLLQAEKFVGNLANSLREYEETEFGYTYAEHSRNSFVNFFNSNSIIKFLTFL